MSEDRFRDEVVRPLFLLQGLKDGREYCGIHEKGKDAVFISPDQLGLNNVYVLQTKKGSLNLTRKTSTNLLEAMTQIRTALETKVYLTKTKEKKLPAKVILCASGQINEHARTHVVDTIKDPRIEFFDGDDLIPLIDDLLPEVWLGIDAEVTPYFRKIAKSVESHEDLLAVSEMLPSGGRVGAASDKIFVPVHVFRVAIKVEKEKGKYVTSPGFEEFPVTSLLDRKEQKILLVGEAGSGKSTCIRRLSYLLAQKGLVEPENYTIPVLLRATELASRPDDTLVEFCRTETERILGTGKPAFSRGDLSEGRVVIFIDALDELADDDSRRRVIQIVEAHIALYPKSKVILTSREHTFIESAPELDNYTSYYVSPIDLPQASQLIDKLRKQRNLPSESSKEIVRRLQQIHGLDLNPLLVTVFIATTDYERKDIPANITELFKKYTEMMLGRWDDSKGLAQQYQAPLKDFLLTRIAYEMHRRQVTNLELKEFQIITERELASRGHKGDTKQILDEVTRSGLFRILDNRLEFRHLLLQEFFAGRGIPSRDSLEGLISDPWWQRAIVFYFGSNPGDVETIDQIRKRIISRPIMERYQAALTLGLAIQACYLAEVKDKLDAVLWVFDSLTEGKEALSQMVDEGRKNPSLRGFLMYYLFGKESVASDLLRDNVKTIQDKWKGWTFSSQEQDERTFWLIVGLIEIGAVAQAEALLSSFRPTDPKLLLGIHMSCTFVQQLRVSTKQERDISERMCKSIASKVNELRVQLYNEFKADLLEMRKGEIKAIENHQSEP
jgi:GTPase SAR1 family protein